MKRLWLRALCPLLLLLAAGVARAQPADDPGLSEPPPPKPAPPPHSDASATLMTPASVENGAPETREVVDTQVQWLDEAGPQTGDDDLYARVPAPTVYGPIGLLRTITGDVGRSNNFRVGLSFQAFTQDNFLVAASGGTAGDTNRRFLGNLTIDYTPWKYLELYLTLFNSSNQNTRPELPVPQGPRTDPEVILALGDVGAGIKGRLPVARWFDLSLNLAVRFFNSVSSVSVEGAATNFAPDLIASFDLRHAEATAKVPLRFHLNFGYLVDNSIHLLPAAQCASSTGNNPCIRSRVVETFGYGIGPSRFRLALAADAPLSFLHGKLGLDIMFEYHVEIAVGDGDQTVLKALMTAPGITSDRLTGNSQQYLTFGFRVRPVAGLILDAGMDLGLSSLGWQYGSPLPTWNVILGAAYAYDPGAGRGRTKVVTKTITRDILHAEGKLRGFVRDAATKKSLSGATIKYLTRRANSQLSDENGGFVSYGMPPGPISIEVSRDDYEAIKVDSSIPANGETPVEVLLTPKPPQNGTLHLKLTDDGGLPIAIATVRLTNTSTGAAVDTETQGAGNFVAKLPGGDYLVEINAETYLSKNRQLTITAGQEQTVDVVLRKKPQTSHVSLGKGEIIIRGTIHFGTNNAEIRPDGEQLLDEVADVLVKHAEIRRVRVEGHTDNRGGVEKNLNLSKARAASVVSYLVKQGIDPTRLESEGYGASQPLVPNITPAQRAKNRRVAFKILDGPR